MQNNFRPYIIHRTLEMYNISSGQMENVTWLDKVFYVNYIHDLFIPNDFYVFTVTKQVWFSDPAYQQAVVVIVVVVVVVAVVVVVVVIVVVVVVCYLETLQSLPFYID